MKQWLSLLVLGTVLAGCSNVSVPSMDLSFMRSSPATVTVRAESNPSGAEARSDGGTSCRTPCVLALSASGVSNVTFALEGYLPQTIAVNVSLATPNTEMAGTGVPEQYRIDPNPLFAALEIQPPPSPPPVRRRPPAKPRAQPAAAAAPPVQPQQQPQQQPAQGWGPPQQQSPGWGPPQQPAPSWGPAR